MILALCLQPHLHPCLLQAHLGDSVSPQRWIWCAWHWWVRRDCCAKTLKLLDAGKSLQGLQGACNLVSSGHSASAWPSCHLRGHWAPVTGLVHICRWPRALVTRVWGSLPIWQQHDGHMTLFLVTRGKWPGSLRDTSLGAWRGPASHHLPEPQSTAVILCLKGKKIKEQIQSVWLTCCALANWRNKFACCHYHFFFCFHLGSRD